MCVGASFLSLGGCPQRVAIVSSYRGHWGFGRDSISQMVDGNASKIRPAMLTKLVPTQVPQTVAPRDSSSVSWPVSPSLNYGPPLALFAPSLRRVSRG